MTPKVALRPKAVNLSENSHSSGCPCGRQHRPPEKGTRRRRGLAEHGKLARQIYDAQARGKAVQGRTAGEWVVNYASDCTNPYVVRRPADSGALLADQLYPCRECANCRRRHMGHWAYRAIAETREAKDAGRRSWFGTLTLGRDAVSETLLQAQEQYGSAHEEWWTDPSCDYRFALHCKVLKRELQLYWKRLRKAGHKFSYLAVFERHESGLPHIHWLLHEKAEPIRKRELEEQWHHGFSKVKLVGGYCRKRRRRLTPEFAAFYVCKYLHKHKQSRQLGSIGYGKTSALSSSKVERQVQGA